MKQLDKQSTWLQLTWPPATVQISSSNWSCCWSFCVTGPLEALEISIASMFDEQVGRRTKLDV